MTDSRRAWIALSSHGARLEVRSNDPNVLDGFERRLPFGSQFTQSATAEKVEDDVGERQPRDAVFALCVDQDRAGDAQTHRLYLDSQLLDSSGNVEDLRRRLESELQFAVASHARSALFVHAGVVGWQGKVILLPGRSMHGKTSLVAALLRCGADYYSDEYAVIDSAGKIHPFPRPLGIRAPDGSQTQVSPEQIGCNVGTEPLSAALVVATRYQPGESFAPIEKGPTRGLMVLIDNTVIVRERSQFALDHLTPAVRTARVLEGPRGEAEDAAVAILDYVSNIVSTQVSTQVSTKGGA